MDKYRSIAVNTLFVMLGTIGSKLIYILMLPLYTRWLSADEFGASDTITTYTDILVTIVFLNIADSIFVFPKMAKTQEEKKEYFSSGLSFIAVMALIWIVLFLFVGVFASHFSEENVFFKYKWLIFGLLVTRYIQVYTQEFTRALDMLKLYSFAGVVLTGGVALFSFLLVPTWGIYGYVYAIILAQVTTSVYSFVMSKSQNFLSFRYIKKKPLNEMLAYSLPLAPNSMMWWLINGINRPMMENQLGLAAIGIYAVASRISGVINSISSIFGLAWGNSVLEEYGKDGFEEFYNNYLRIITTLYFIGCIFLVIFSRPLVALFTTEEYYDAALYIPLLSLGLCFSCMGMSVGSIFSAVKKSKYFFYASVWGGIVSVGSLLILMPLLHLLGVAISLMLSFLTIMFVRWYFASKYVYIRKKMYYVFLVGMFMIVYMSDLYIESFVKYFIDAAVVLGIIYMMRVELIKMFQVLFNRSFKK